MRQDAEIKKKIPESQQPLSPESHERVGNLGKELVEELGLESSDTLSHWMANHIAEQMAIANNATGQEKINAEKQCFDTILKLWKRRSTFPHKQHPSEKKKEKKDPAMSKNMRDLIAFGASNQELLALRRKEIENMTEREFWEGEKDED